MTISTEPTVLHIVLIKPSHYDDDGYVIQWVKSIIPSNSLASVYGLVRDCAERRVMGPDVDIKVSVHDEANTRIKTEKIVRQLKRPDVRGLIGLIGVQSNQFPRALNLARKFRDQGIQVCMGGFHVSGCISMLPGMQPDLQEAMDFGVSLFAGEAEGRMDQILSDAFNGCMRPLYNFMQALPDIENTPIPCLPKNHLHRNMSLETTFDAGRGCPFLCSFCTIINVQGRKSRHRSADDVERIVRTNLKQGINYYFVTDDNFTRNQGWESILDRLIELKEKENLPIKLVLQVDTMCHKIPNFIDKAVRAGVHKVFVGLESINPDTLAIARKKQNRITEYRRMFQAWKKNGVVTCAGYILGFPDDTPETILRDIEIIKRELPLDILEFFFLTPLPGSEDHKKLYDQGVWMDPDMNNYDVIHATTEHPKMTAQQWKDIYNKAWDTYFSPQHIKTLLYRARVSGISVKRIDKISFGFYASHLAEQVHPLDSGLFRRKYRRDRRPTLPTENFFVFYLRYAWEIIRKTMVALKIYQRHMRLYRQVMRDPQGTDYTDIALSPATSEALDRFEMFTAAEAPESAVEKLRKK